MRPRRGSLCVVLWSAFLVLAAVSTSTAADPVAEAREHYDAGKRLYDIGRYAEALEEYEKAYQAKPDPALLYNIAVCHRKLGHTQQALEAYRSFLRRQPTTPRRESVERIIATLEREVASAPVDAARAPAVVPAVRPAEPNGIGLAARAVPAPEPTPVLKRPWVWVAAGAVVVGAAIAVAFATSNTERVFACPDCQGTRAVP